MIGNFWKAAGSDALQAEARSKGGDPYRVTKDPLVPRDSRGHQSRSGSQDYENLGDLPRFYGQPVLFGIARDPHSLYVYWEIDWHKTFGERPPADRKAYLRVISDDGSEEIRVAVEPFAGNHLVPVTQARSIYRIELGYEEPTGVWHSVAESKGIATPPDDISDNAGIDVATVPFHLSFQHMIDRFRAGRDRKTLIRMVSRLQDRADDVGEEDLPESDRELLRGLGSGSGMGMVYRARLRKAADALATRRQVEAVLGVGVSSW